MQMFKTVGALALLTALTACGGTPAASPAPTTSPAADEPATAAPATTPTEIAGTSWVLSTLGGAAVLAEPLVTLNFADGRMSGSDGCNSYSGSYSASGATLTVGKDVVSTMMACAEPIMQQAGAYSTALQAVSSYAITGDTLKLVNANNAELATFAAQTQGLADTQWTATGVNNGKQAVVSLVNGSNITVNFGSDGRVSGSGGCNTFTGSYVASGDTITISQLVSTEMMCMEPTGVMDQEAQLLAALTSAATYRRDGNKLELRTADGALAVSLTAAR